MKVDNIRPRKFDSPYTTRPTWLAQKALRGMKVATPSLNWIPLSSTFGRGVSVLASGRLQYLGYATGNSPSWASRGDDWPLRRGHNMILVLRSTGNYSFMAKSFPHLRSESDSPHFAVSTSHILSGVVRARNQMQRGTWLVERRFSDKPKVVTRHSGVSYSCLLVPVVRHSPPRTRASALPARVRRVPPARVRRAPRREH